MSVQLSYPRERRWENQIDGGFIMAVSKAMNTIQHHCLRFAKACVTYHSVVIACRSLVIACISRSRKLKFVELLESSLNTEEVLYMSQ